MRTQIRLSQLLIFVIHLVVWPWMITRRLRWLPGVIHLVKATVLALKRKSAWSLKVQKWKLRALVGLILTAQVRATTRPRLALKGRGRLRPINGIWNISKFYWAMSGSLQPARQAISNGHQRRPRTPHKLRKRMIAQRHSRS